MRRLLSLTLAGVGLFAPASMHSCPSGLHPSRGAADKSWSLPVQTLVFITSLTFIPAILLMMTSFTPSSSSLVCCETRWEPLRAAKPGSAAGAVFDLFHYSPVIDKIYTDAYQPFSEDKISMQEALDKGAQPLRNLCCARRAKPTLPSLPACPTPARCRDRKRCQCVILLPAYVTSELKNRVPDWLYHLYSVPDYRPGDRQRPDGARDDDGAARDHCPAL